MREVLAGLDLSTNNDRTATAFEIELATGFQQRCLVADLAVDLGV
ncbi:hypothetical protein [Zoogloea sp.]|nr:hypothetical protein [Zoogloea sp.]